MGKTLDVINAEYFWDMELERLRREMLDLIVRRCEGDLNVHSYDIWLNFTTEDCDYEIIMAYNNGDSRVTKSFNLTVNEFRRNLLKILDCAV